MTPIHILLVEDNRADIALIRESLKQYEINHELHVVKDGAEAILFLNVIGSADGPPRLDLILLDMNLPKVGGPQVLSSFRKHRDCALTPAIVVSSSDAPKEKELMEHLGVNYYFKKSSDFEEYMKLGAVVKQVLGSISLLD